MNTVSIIFRNLKMNFYNFENKKLKNKNKEI